MSEMVQRVARVLCIADGKNPDADWRVSDNGLTLDMIDDEPENWRRYTAKARAAIQAMREPTADMLTFSSFKSADDLYRYQAMIDAALKD